MKYAIMMILGGIIGITIFNFVYVAYGITEKHIKELQFRKKLFKMLIFKAFSIERPPPIIANELFIELSENINELPPWIYIAPPFILDETVSKVVFTILAWVWKR